MLLRLLVVEGRLPLPHSGVVVGGWQRMPKKEQDHEWEGVRGYCHCLDLWGGRREGRRSRRVPKRDFPA